jgi:hypothetical protein
MHFRVGIEREPFADEGQPVGEVEGAKARSRVVAAVFAPVRGEAKLKKLFRKV